ncbi:MAG: Do family serine endopeptidase [Bryobacteraceae bacterium]|jgi:serine protease Do
MTMLKNRKTVAALALAAGLLLGTWINSGVKAASAAASPAPDAAQLTVPNPVQLSTAFTQLAKQLEPSVVQVTSTVEQKQVRSRGRATPQPFGEDGPDLFRRFFGDNPFGDLPQQPRRAEGTGSGFIVDRNGYILTNNHVVDGATRVRVQLHGNDTEYTAKVIGTDPELDLAVLKIEAGRPLAPVRIGNSDGVQVGDWAVAIGSPFGLEATVTAGIISAKGRAIGDYQLQRFLQTDAAINPGNSGGPLLNINGEVIGVNTMIATNSGAYQGVGFALPINLAVNSYNQIVKTGKVSRGAIGIQFERNQKPELLKAYGGGAAGVFVTRVTPHTPAERAGVREGDIITGFNGKPVKDGDDLVSMVSQTPVGKQVPLAVLRDGKTVDLTITIGDRAEIVAGDSGSGRPGSEERGGEEGTPVKLGLSVRNLGAGERDSMNFQEKGGVLVTSVEDGSFADDIGMREGDIIVVMNRQLVASAADLKRIAAELKPGDAVALKVMRNAAGPGARRSASDWQTFFAAGTLPRN